MLKAVALTILMFVMSCFKLPSAFCSELESLTTNFLWGQKEDEKKIYWVRWRKDGCAKI